MGFKIIYSGNKTFLRYSLAMKVEINISQHQRFNTGEFLEYFLPSEYTRTTLTNQISYDISGLTALSEYLKMNLTQEKYFEIIRGIQQIVSFCHEKAISYGNLICDPKYMYYHNALNKVLMAYVPLQNPNHVSDSIPQCLIKLHKIAKHVAITDMNYMNHYQQYLAQFSGRKGKIPPFSPNSLLHFFNENALSANEEMVAVGAVTPARTVATRDVPSIYEQMKSKTERGKVPVAPAPPPQAPVLTPTPAPASQPQPQTPAPPSMPTPPKKKEGGTVVTSRTRTQVYLTDNSGKRFYVTTIPFNIGRTEENHLQVPYDSVSGSHAQILMENGEYYIKDVSRNGTYQNDYYNRITYSKLSDKDILFFDSYKYQFHLEDTAHPAPAPEPEPERKKPQTLIVSRHTRVEKPLAYLKAQTGNNIPIMQFPFQDTLLSGVIFGSDTSSGRTVLFVQNISCPSFQIEEQPVPIGESIELFSGCSLCVNGEKYIFSVEN